MLRTPAPAQAGRQHRTSNRPSHRAPRSRPKLVFYPLASLASLALGGLSLLLMPHAIGYDAWTWLIWGRELAHGRLSTLGAGDSFKPLTTGVNAVFAFTGSAEPSVWLVVSRAAAAFAVMLAFRVAWRLSGCRRVGGVAAGTIAGAGLLTSLQYVSYLSAESDPISAACCLAAVDAHLSRRRWLTMAGLVGAALVRIELWSAVALYGAWWLWSERSGWRLRAAAISAVLVALPAAWLLPDLISTGDLLRSAHQAAIATNSKTLLARFPGLAVISESHQLMLVPFGVLFAVGVVAAVVLSVRRRRVEPALGVAAFALFIVAEEAVLAQLRLDTGNSRYLLETVALAAVVGGWAWGEAVRVLGAELRHPKRVRSLGTLVLVALCAVPVIHWTGSVRRDLVGRARLAELDASIPEAIDAAGGRAHLLACGPVVTDWTVVPALTWALKVPFASGALRDVRPTGTVLAVRQGQGRKAPRGPYPRAYRGPVRLNIGHGSKWLIYSTCPLRR